MMASIIGLWGLPITVGSRLLAYTKGYDNDPDPVRQLSDRIT